VGRADAVFPAPRDGRAAPAHARAARRKWRSASRAPASRPGSRCAAKIDRRPKRRSTRRAVTRSRLVRFRLDAFPPCCAARTRRHRLPGASVPRRLRPAPRLVPLVAAGRVHAGWHPALQSAPHPRLRRRRRGPQDVEIEGHVIAPQEVSHTLGAEILRLWVASTDYSASCSSPTRS